MGGAGSEMRGGVDAESGLLNPVDTDGDLLQSRD